MGGEGAARWSDEDVVRVAEAIAAADTDQGSFDVDDMPNDYYEHLARAALGVIPPDPVIAAIREWAADTSIRTDPAKRSTVAYDRGFTDARRAIARLVADGAGT